MLDDLPPDLDRLTTLRTWHAMWLERIDRRIASVQKRQAEEERGRRSRPLPPDWVVELSRATGGPLQVHDGECGMKGRRHRAACTRAAPPPWDIWPNGTGRLRRVPRTPTRPARQHGFVGCPPASAGHPVPAIVSSQHIGYLFDQGKVTSRYSPDRQQAGTAGRSNWPSGVCCWRGGASREWCTAQIERTPARWPTRPD